MITGLRNVGSGPTIYGIIIVLVAMGCAMSTSALLGLSRVQEGLTDIGPSTRLDDAARAASSLLAIARENIHEAARGTAEVAIGIAAVNRRAGETGRAVSQVISAADDLTAQGERREAQPTAFIATVEAA
jgi:hypothetical protein